MNRFRSTRQPPDDDTQFDTVVIGAGHAGLTMGYYLRRMGQRFVVLDANPRVGDSWRRRWDSLRLFSTARYASLPGWRMPIAAGTFPTRDEMADYLQAYAVRCALPVRSGVRVTALRQDSAGGHGFLVVTDAGCLRARQVVVAVGGNRLPVAPALAAHLDPGIRQLHSLAYRNSDQLGSGPLLIVGAGNSGTDIAREAREADPSRPVWLSGRNPGQVPITIDSPWARPVIPIAMFAFRHLLTMRTPMGRAIRADVLAHGATVVRNKREDLRAAGVVLTGRIVDVRDGLPMTESSEQLNPSTVLWCTGSRPDYQWIELPVIGADGHPLHRRGVVESVPGLYFLGLEFQFALASGTIQGVPRDARYLARQIARRTRGRSLTAGPESSPVRPESLPVGRSRCRSGRSRCRLRSLPFRSRCRSGRSRCRCTAPNRSRWCRTRSVRGSAKQGQRSEYPIDLVLQSIRAGGEIGESTAHRIRQVVLVSVHRLQRRPGELGLDDQLPTQLAGVG